MLRYAFLLMMATLISSGVVSQNIVTLQPDRMKCIGDTLQVPIQLTGVNVFNMVFYITYDHNLLVPYATPYMQVLPGFIVSGFNPVYNPTTMAVFMDATGWQGLNLNGARMVKLIFKVMNTGTTTLQLRTSPMNSPLSGIWNDLGMPVLPVTYVNAQITALAQVPDPAGAISGPSTVIPGSFNVSYAISPVPNTTGYAWSLPAGASIITGFNTPSITVNFSASAVSGSISVFGMNACGNGSPSPAFPLTVMPILPTTITVQGITVPGGQTNCYNATQTIYVAGSGTTFVVQPGGSATMIAGHNIFYYPGTTVQPGGYMHGYIAPAGPWCLPTLAPSMATIVTGNYEIPSDSDQCLFKVYPNPTTGNFTVEQTGEKIYEKVKVEVYSMIGGRVFTGEMTGERKQMFSLEDVPVGFYFIRLLAGDIPETIKIIKH